MLRRLTLVLLLANAGFAAWIHTPMAQVLGLPSPTAPREPERLARQLNPDLIRVLPPGKARAPGAAAPGTSAATPTIAAASRTASTSTAASGSAASATAPAASDARPAAASAAATTAACLQAGPLSDNAFDELTRQLLRLGLHSDRWVDIRRELPGRWAVYMGRFADADALQRKRDELSRMKLPHEELAGHPTLSPGLTLGRYPSDAEAQARLAQLQSRGVRTARVVPLAPPTVEHRIQIDGLSPAQTDQLKALPAKLDWQACSAKG